MSVYKATSWGRTRRPKAIQNGGVETYQVKGVTATKVEYVTSISDFSDSLSGATEGQNGYATENQRFLHMLLDTTTQDEDRTVTVYGYTYASNRWSTMRDVRGNPISLQCNNQAIYQIFEISGVDRVYFKTNNALHANNHFYAAFSTF